MNNRILSFTEFSSIYESLESQSMEGIDQILSPEKKDQMIIQLAKVGITKDSPGQFKFVDDEGVEYTLEITPEGEILVAEGLAEGFRKNLITGVVCTMLATGMVSCQKEDSYNIGRDARYILKPEILNLQGKEYFDSPVGSKDKIYVWAGNQTGAGRGYERYLYHDYSNKIKDYGAVYGRNYPDSFAQGANGITPVEVVKKIRFTPDLAQRLQAYTKMDLSKYTEESTTLGKNDPNSSKPGLYVIVVKVHGSSYYDWENPNGEGKETRDPKWKTGYAIYLVTPEIAENMQRGELYPTMLDVMFNFYNNQGQGNSDIKPLDDYFSSNFKKLLPEEPVL